MLAGKNTGALAFGSLALQALPQTSPMLGKRHFRQELSGDGVRGGAPAENGFSVIWSPQIASDDSKCFTRVLKSGGYGTPQSKKWGVRYAYDYTVRQTSPSRRSTLQQVHVIVRPPRLL